MNEIGNKIKEELKRNVDFVKKYGTLEGLFV